VIHYKSVLLSYLLAYLMLILQDRNLLLSIKIMSHITQQAT